MHYQNKCTDIYEIDGDFEGFLLNVGVSKEHINKMKTKKIKSMDFLDYVCESDDSCIQEELIPVDRIVGVRRAVPNKSVFENICKFNRSTFNNLKMERCLNFAKTMPYDDLKKSYVNNIEAIGRVAHIVETDEYYLIGEHNHTTMCAMIFDAPQIRAKVQEYHINMIKKQKYDEVLEFFQAYSIQDIEIKCPNRIRVLFNDSDGLYYVEYKNIHIVENKNEILDLLSSKINSDKKRIALYKKIPLKILQNIFFRLLSNQQKMMIEKNKYNDKDPEYRSFKLFYLN